MKSTKPVKNVFFPFSIYFSISYVRETISGCAPSSSPILFYCVSNTVDALKPAKIATKCLQSDQLTAGEFYGIWLKCSLDTEKLGSPFARKLAQCLKTHQSMLFDNEIHTMQPAAPLGAQKPPRPLLNHHLTMKLSTFCCKRRKRPALASNHPRTP